ncbi:hypothetical protein LZ554_005376 [Drepanopeziza brunnea f. sp. 'monogermtubi']|nr:hypothetical protein LZ554_005376 [Drepanopeziza brunnea f. sp. 'monogermtubi']
MPPPLIPRSFPQALNIGTDICSVQRVNKILRGRQAQAFIRRVLRAEEIAQNRRLLSAVDRLQELELLINTATTTSERAVHQPPIAQQHARGEGERQSQSQSIPRMLPNPNSSIRALGNPAAAARTQGGKEEGAVLEPGTTTPASTGTRARARHASELPDAVLAVERCAQFLAGRFAAKEAVMKAHHSRRLTYHSICILKPPPRRDVPGSVPPIAVVLPEVGEGEEEESDGGLGRAEEVRISISHDGGFAVASCLARDEGGDGDYRMRCFAEAFRGGAVAG